MKITKKFNKMSRDEQEAWLVTQLMGIQETERKLRRLLASVRGGQRVEILAEERPDEIVLKESA